MLGSSAFGVFPSADAQKIKTIFNELGKQDAIYFIVAQRINKRSMPEAEKLLRQFLE